MKQIALILALALLPAASQAACYADYKAKQDNPLRLHYGVMQISPGGCPAPGAAAAQVAARLTGTGWTLLNVVSVSTAPPSAQQKADAGDYYLRY